MTNTSVQKLEFPFGTITAESFAVEIRRHNDSTYIAHGGKTFDRFEAAEDLADHINGRIGRSIVFDAAGAAEAYVVTADGTEV